MKDPVLEAMMSKKVLREDLPLRKLLWGENAHLWLGFRLVDAWQNQCDFAGALRPRLFPVQDIVVCWLDDIRYGLRWLAALLASTK